MPTQALFRALDKKAVWLAVILLLAAILAPLSNLALPDGHPLHLPNYAAPPVWQISDLCHTGARP